MPPRNFGEKRSRWERSPSTGSAHALIDAHFAAERVTEAEAARNEAIRTAARQGISAREIAAAVNLRVRDVLEITGPLKRSIRAAG